MATVYRAEQMPLGREVAIKVLHQHLARDPEMTERFRREAEAAAQLVHPFICPMLDFGQSGEVVYIVMPYLGGGSLADKVQKDRVVSPVFMAGAAAQVAVALDHAHRRGVVHRDVKPDNILFDDDGNAFITDFGIATARFHARLTASGRAMGTPHYMSPEQAMGKLVDGRSDLYALGVVMYEALVGFPPFDIAAPAHLKLLSSDTCSSSASTHSPPARETPIHTSTAAIKVNTEIGGLNLTAILLGSPVYRAYGRRANFQRNNHAPIQPRARRNACHQHRDRIYQARRGFVPDLVRRYAGAVHRLD